jgi:hypothetical protein
MFSLLDLAGLTMLVEGVAVVDVRLSGRQRRLIPEELVLGPVGLDGVSEIALDSADEGNLPRVSGQAVDPADPVRHRDIYVQGPEQIWTTHAAS